ncbi:recombinase family protein [Streptomyces sp. NPDC007157]|uniref:recombinase family protein n=1 Tax=Streptomyces sp. NPDC007157 TaxID=3154681 RepID=UPI0033E88783
MSKGERNRIKIRVRTAMSSHAQLQGRYLGGRPPYGYLIGDAGPHPNPAKAATGQRIHRLEPDPAVAPTVARIFQMYVDGMSDKAIAAQVTREGIPCPSAHDAARNPHRKKTAWQAGAVRAILINPRYTGYEIWNKQPLIGRLPAAPPTGRRPYVFHGRRRWSQPVRPAPCRRERRRRGLLDIRAVPAHLPSLRA